MGNGFEDQGIEVNVASLVFIFNLLELAWKQFFIYVLIVVDFGGSLLFEFVCHVYYFRRFCYI